ncbi:MAG: cytochrome P450 [Actinobacteria bacterium]|nr:cytochrome P450 [Actinomycetota bacterium]
MADFDITDPAVIADPYPAFERMRALGRPVWDDGLGMWLAFRHEDANAVLRDRALGRIWRARVPEDAWETFNWLHADALLENEPPKHTRLRRLVAAAFARGNIESRRGRIQELCAALLDDCQAKLDSTGSFDAIADYAEPLPVLVIADLLGVPDDEIGPLRPWSQAIVKMYEYDRTPEDDAAAEVACREFAAYVDELVERRRTEPGDDLVTHLAQVEAEGDRLTAHELAATVVLLLNAGHEATVNGFGNGLVALLQHRDQWDRVVADPWGLATTAVEEMLRYDTPSALFERTALADVEVGGVTIAEGQKVAALLGSANRDGAVFADPDSFDVGRDPNPHIAFGAGIHFCLGGPLARLEMQQSLPMLAERFPSLHEAGPAQQRGTFVLRGYDTVPVTV